MSIDLPDHGVSPIKGIKENKQFFIKFFGSGENRADLNYSVRNMIKDSHCHFAITFSGKRGRPRKYKNGDIVYLARILNGKDYAIFGKAIAIQHNDKRDIASPEDIAHLSWKKDFPIYIRIEDPVFVDGNMIDCPKISDLIGDLDVEAFSWTNRRTLEGETDINPWNSLRRQADVELTEIAAEWLERKFCIALSDKGTIPSLFINDLYKSVLPKY